jgi:hypothetical protein
MDEDGLGELLELQDGVIARRQALELECSANDIRRLLRRREWVRVFPGVYVDHTGPLTWQQRAWAAVLLAWPAALCHDTAIRAADGPGRRTFDESAPLHVAVDRARSFVADPAQITAHHMAGLDDKVNWNLRPPRVRMEHAVLDVAAEADDDFAAIEVLANAVQSRRTTAPRILAVTIAPGSHVASSWRRRSVTSRREPAPCSSMDISTASSVLTPSRVHNDRSERPHVDRSIET